MGSPFHWAVEEAVFGEETHSLLRDEHSGKEAVSRVPIAAKVAFFLVEVEMIIVFDFVVAASVDVVVGASVRVVVVGASVEVVVGASVVVVVAGASVGVVVVGGTGNFLHFKLSRESLLPFGPSGFVSMQRLSSVAAISEPVSIVFKSSVKKTAYPGRKG